MATEIKSFRDLIELWPTREALAAEIGANSNTVSKWWQRDNVPAEYWAPILSSEVAIRARLRPDALIDLANVENH